MSNILIMKQILKKFLLFTGNQRRYPRGYTRSITTPGWDEQQCESSYRFGWNNDTEGEERRNNHRTRNQFPNGEVSHAVELFDKLDVCGAEKVFGWVWIE